VEEDRSSQGGGRAVASRRPGCRGMLHRVEARSPCQMEEAHRYRVEEAASLPGVEVGLLPGCHAGWGRPRRCWVEDAASLLGAARERKW
jgi:hypothetical protein